MRGAGTTPILSNVPEGGFGDAVETAEEVTAPVTSASEQPVADIWGSGTATASTSPTITAPSTTTTTAACDDFFGAPFEPTPATTTVPTAVVTPLSMPPQPAENTDNTEKDLFGFDTNELNEIGDQPMSAQPCAAPPPSPFGGLEIGLGSVSAPSQDLRAQAIANAVGAALPGVVPQQPAPIPPPAPVPASTVFDDLNFALSQPMQPTTPVLAASPTVGVLPGPRPGFVGQPFPPMAAAAGFPMGTSPSPASTSLNQLDNIVGVAGIPTARASSTSGYGTPSSGMSSPAKSVSSLGGPMPGDFASYLTWSFLSYTSPPQLDVQLI